MSTRNLLVGCRLALYPRTSLMGTATHTFVGGPVHAGHAPPPRTSWVDKAIVIARFQSESCEENQDMCKCHVSVPLAAICTAFADLLSFLHIHGHLFLSAFLRPRQTAS